MASLLDEIVGAQAPAFEQRQKNRAMAGGSRDGLAVWDDGSLFINADGATDLNETSRFAFGEPTEADRTLVKNAINGDKAARSQLELQAALGDQAALNALVRIDQFIAANDPISSATVIDRATLRAAGKGDPEALRRINAAAAAGSPSAIAAQKQLISSQPGLAALGGGAGTPAASAASRSGSAPRAPSGGGGGKKPFQNTKGNPSSIPHIRGTGAQFENSSPGKPDLPGNFSDLPPVKSSVKPPPQKGDGDKVHAYGNPHAKTGDVDIVDGKFVWKGEDQDYISGLLSLPRPKPGTPKF
jgi:hypothetical protein